MLMLFYSSEKNETNELIFNYFDEHAIIECNHRGRGKNFKSQAAKNRTKASFDSNLMRLKVSASVFKS